MNRPLGPPPPDRNFGHPMPYDHTILGAGLAGLSAGYNLSRGGRSVSLLEKEPYVGGLAASFTRDGYTYDLGPHRFHTRNRKVQEQVEALLADNIHWRERLSRIYMLGRFFHYPLKAGNVVRNLPPWLLFRSFLDYLVVRVQDRIRPIPDDCFQNWVLKRFGKTLYRLFFGTYTEKAWGIPCTQISADWASQRITLLNLFDTVKKTLLRPRNEPRTLVSRFLYPRTGGIGTISRRYAEEILSEEGNRILTGVEVRRILHDGGRILGVDFVHDGEEHREEVRSLISTIPVTTLIDLMDPAAPDDVLRARRSLRYKAIVFVFLALDRDKVTDDHWIYLPEQHLKVHRISEFKNFSEHCAPPGRTMLAAEITCNYGDHIWNMDVEGLTDLAAKDLEKVGLIRRSEVVHSFVHRERFSYPLYDLEYRTHLARCMEWLKSFENLHATGRQGLFQYGNMDHSIAMGLVLAERLLHRTDEEHEQILAREEHVDG